MAEAWPDYALLDSGDGRKLERFGRLLLDRPDSQAIWHRSLPAERWAVADARFLAGREEEGSGRWEAKAGGLPAPWPIAYGPVRIEAQLTAFRHLGIFPEQRVHWDRVVDVVQARAGETALLNLFGYTGMASLLPAAAGAKVTHVDASKKAIAWARVNQEMSGLADAPIRWICDDAARFAAREVRRGSRYDVIVLDPPKYGRGPKNEVWRLEEQLPQLLADCRALMDERSSTLVLTAYATHLSMLTLQRLLEDAFAGLPGTISVGEMALREETTGRLLPTSLYVSWSRDA
ncbi:class I SAM-dependent methyltransferase [Thalassobaculum sp.]|uniref:class I SAM-dependent methyltransferase n=1 Tax=Thalassobaculum sp. TaxID=2022740 RepID=UPI0032EEB293